MPTTDGDVRTRLHARRLKRLPVALLTIEYIFLGEAQEGEQAEHRSLMLANYGRVVLAAFAPSSRVSVCGSYPPSAGRTKPWRLGWRRWDWQK